MASKRINLASLYLLVLAVLMATSTAAHFDYRNGDYNYLSCKNSTPLEAMELSVKKMLNLTKNARMPFDAKQDTNKAGKACAKAYKNAEFELKQVREILKSKDFGAVRTCMLAAYLHYSKCWESMAQQNEAGIMAGNNEELVKQMTVFSSLSTVKCTTQSCVV